MPEGVYSLFLYQPCTSPPTQRDLSNTTGAQLDTSAVLGVIVHILGTDFSQKMIKMTISTQTWHLYKYIAVISLNLCITKGVELQQICLYRFELI